MTGYRFDCPGCAFETVARVGGSEALDLADAHAGACEGIEDWQVVSFRRIPAAPGDGARSPDAPPGE